MSLLSFFVFLVTRIVFLPEMVATSIFSISFGFNLSKSSLVDCFPSMITSFSFVKLGKSFLILNDFKSTESFLIPFSSCGIIFSCATTSIWKNQRNLF
ncbi:MAG: hypothetical protein B7Y83_13760 [Flavobacteriales bacterium 32-34-25]|nr:MAG: hypothetical protein B7Y83_13760 [Flavobacteriales bacterium 32-34-25]